MQSEQTGNYTLLLLPGLDGTGVLFKPFIESLPAEIHCIVCSYPTDSELSYEDYIAKVIETAPAGGFHLLAESFSGKIALGVLNKNKLKVKSVILIATFLEFHLPKILQAILSLPLFPWMIKYSPWFLVNFFCFNGQATAKISKLFRQCINTVSSNVIKSRLKIITKRIIFAKLKMKIPCLYLQAAGDRLVGAGHAESFRDFFGELNVKVLDGPHLLLQSKPEETRDVIIEYLKSLN